MATTQPDQAILVITPGGVTEMSSSIEQYLASGELPDDPAVLAQLYKEAIGNEAGTELVEAEPVKAEEASAATSAGEAEKEPDGIFTKDGKHIISYDVLTSERKQRQDAARKVEELQAEVERLKSAPAQVDLTAIGIMSAERLEELKEYFPDEYEAIIAQQAALIEAKQLLAKSEQDKAAQIAEQNRQVQLSVQEEIDNNPALSHWQRKDPEAFAYCVQQDNLLRENPKTANLSMTERFAKAVALTAQIYDLPVSDKPKPVATAKARPLINSLSDIPGGEPVEASEKERVQDMSGAELGNMLMKMNPEQRASYIASIGQ